MNRLRYVMPQTHVRQACFNTTLLRSSSYGDAEFHDDPPPDGFDVRGRDEWYEWGRAERE